MFKSNSSSSKVVGSAASPKRSDKSERTRKNPNGKGNHLKRPDSPRKMNVYVPRHVNGLLHDVPGVAWVESDKNPVKLVVNYLAIKAYHDCEPVD